MDPPSRRFTNRTFNFASLATQRWGVLLRTLARRVVKTLSWIVLPFLQSKSPYLRLLFIMRVLSTLSESSFSFLFALFLVLNLPSVDGPTK